MSYASSLSCLQSFFRIYIPCMILRLVRLIFCNFMTFTTFINYDYPTLNSNLIPGVNLNAPAIGRCVTSIEEHVKNHDAALFNTWIRCHATLVNKDLIVFFISTHFTSVHPLYDRCERPTTNKPILTAENLLTVFIS